MSVLHAVWLTVRLIGGVALTGVELYVVYVGVVDAPRVERAWRVLRGRTVHSEGKR